MKDNRVLNFHEFAGKYNQEAQQDAAASFSDFSTASDNFTDAFDEESYNQDQLGPNKPLGAGDEATPAQPGEEGAPDFKSEAPKGMEVPEEGAETEGEEAPAEEEEDGFEGEEAPAEEVESEDADADWEDGGDPEEGEEDDDEESKEDDDEDTNESFLWKTSNKVILESFDSFGKGMPAMQRAKSHSHGGGGYSDVIDNIELDFEDGDENIMNGQEDEGCFVQCKSCGAQQEVPNGVSPFGQANVDNPDSWWQGAEYGMQCGCK